MTRRKRKANDPWKPPPWFFSESQKRANAAVAKAARGIKDNINAAYSKLTGSKTKILPRPKPRRFTVRFRKGK